MVNVGSIPIDATNNINLKVKHMETKRTKVVMLPTKKEPALYNHITESGIGAYSHLELQDKPNTNMYFKAEGQHLYFVNDDKKKKGDWCCRVNINSTTLCEATLNDLHNPIENNKLYKVIATTNISLSQTSRTKIPQPSQAFIEKYCKVGGIDEVMIEYINTTGYPHNIKVDKPKVNSHNEITIHPIKNNWTREEVKDIQLEAFEQGRKLTQNNWEKEDFKDFKKINIY